MTRALDPWCLKVTDLEGLPHAVESDPMIPVYQPFHLYRLVDVRGAAVRRWGSIAGVEEERIRRRRK
jgi:hypothetical protein